MTDTETEVESVAVPRFDPKTTDTRLYAVAGGDVHYDGELVSDSYAMWKAGIGVPAPLYAPFAKLEAGRYEARAKELRRVYGTPTRSEALAGVWGPAVEAERFELRWAGHGVILQKGCRKDFKATRHGANKVRDQIAMSPDTEAAFVDVWHTADGIELVTNVRYRPLLMAESQYDDRRVYGTSHEAGQAGPDETRPLVVTSGAGEDVALVMPIKVTGSANRLLWLER